MHLDFARNLESKNKLQASEKRELQYKSASFFALFWNIVKSLGPTEVVDDMETFIQTNKLYKMDPAIMEGGKQQTYTIDVGDGVPLTFHNADLAPPSGVFARNYARYTLYTMQYIDAYFEIRAVHRENQPHKWTSSWTTFRDSNDTGNMGGHFYIAEYGIRIRAATNKAVFWRPGDWHGTSLPRLVPSEKGGPLLQCGAAIVTSPRLPAAFQQFHEGKLSADEVKVVAAKVDEIGLENAFENISL